MNGWTIGSALRGGVSSRALILALSAPLAVASVSSVACAGGALPSNGQYVAGSGSIAKKSGGLTIDQSSKSGIIDWTSFSVGKNKTVSFDNGNGATLNRVTGGNLSTIAGSLKATGSLYLINTQGMIVSGTGKIVTGGTFIGSSRDESDGDFLGGKRRFTGSSKGNVTNEGTIRSSTGDVALIGHSASNSGTISAKNGAASLTAADTVYLAPAGSGGRVLVSGGTGDAINSGTITAAQAALTAAGGNVYALSGNNGGIIRATGTSTIAGHVWLTSGSGTTTVSGTIDAKNADGSGGAIVATGKTIDVTGTASLSASGTRGGTILIGGDIHGGAIAADNFVHHTTATADTTTIASGATITADASKGSGGHVVVWSNKQTNFAGSISAKGSNGLAGGFSEVSSHDLLGFTGKVDLTAANGKTGTLLLDPYDVVISSDASSTDTLKSGSFQPTGNTSFINTATLEAALGTASVKVVTGATGSQEGNISVIDSLTWSSGSTLTLDAYHSITVAAAISVTGTGGVTLITNDGGSGGTLNFLAPLSFTSPSDALTINGQIYTLENSISQLTSGIAGSPSGFFALSQSIDASGTTYSATPIPTNFTGTFEGLGNTISSLKISDTNDTYVGLFGEIDAGGVVRDIILLNPSITADTSSAGNGPLVGINYGTVQSSMSIGGSVTDSAGATDGGLVGANHGTISSSIASTSITGGFVIGGLVGFNEGTIENSTAKGAVSTTVAESAAGGLLGLMDTGSVSQSVATGAVSVATNEEAGGGLIGTLLGGEVTNSYSSGSITGQANSYIGGLIGYADAGTVTDAYALGAVSLIGGGTSSQGGVGGLVGVGGATIDQVYETGKVSNSASGEAVGGLVGSSSGAITNAYFDISTAGTSSAVGSGSSTGVVGLTTGQMRNADNMNFDFGTLPGTDGWVIADLDGTFNNAGGSNGATLPMLLDEATASSDVHIISNVHQLQLVGLDPTGTYFIGDNIDASATSTGQDVWSRSTGFVPIYSGGPFSKNSPYFSGNVFGLGNSIDALAIDNSAIGAIGLFSEIAQSGRIEDLQLTNESITTNSAASVGGLVGISYGTLVNTGVGGSVEDLSGNTGGIVGVNNGKIVKSFTTDNVSNIGSGSAGGLVGQNAGTISESYSLGSVNGGSNSDIGGLVGNNLASGTINQAYSIGDVTSTGTASLAGLVGSNSNTAATAIQNAFWDTQTSGQSVGVGGVTSTGVVGQTTAQLQNAVPAGFAASDWNVIPATSFPYLNWQYTNGAPLIVSGLVSGSLENSGLPIQLLVNDTSVTPALSLGTEANGYYYLVLPANSIPSNSQLIAYIKGSSTIAEAYYQDANSSISNLALQTAFLTAYSDATTLSDLGGGYIAALGGEVGAEGVNNFLLGTSSINIVDRASSFDVDQAYNASTFVINAAGNLTIDSAITAGSGGIVLETQGAAQSIAINAAMNATGSVDLISTGVVTQSSSGIITAQALTGSSDGAVTLNGANVIANLGTFTTEANPFALTDATDLTVAGNVTAKSHGLTLTTTGRGHDIFVKGTLAGTTVKLASAATVVESGAGKIVATTLTGVSHGATKLNGANVVANLASFGTASSGFALTNAADLTVTGNVTAKAHELSLTTTGTGHDIFVQDVLSGGAVALNSAATLKESGSGEVVATTLSGSSVGAIELNNSNNISNLGAFTTGGNHPLELVDASALTVDGAITAGSSAIDLTNTGSNNGINIDGSLTGGTVSIFTAGEVTESNSVSITAGNLLNVTASTGINLSSTKNHIHAVGTRQTSSGPNIINGIGQ